MLITRNQIIFGDRAREVYSNIDTLAESIRVHGLEQPIILWKLDDDKYLLSDGGRRLTAMDTLGYTSFEHAITGIPGRPGFIVKSTPPEDTDRYLCELIANLHRQDMTWYEEVKLIRSAWESESRKAAMRNEEIIYATLGKMLGNYGYADINAAIHVSQVYKDSPEIFEGCTTITQAYAKLLAFRKQQIAKTLASRFTQKPLAIETAIQQVINTEHKSVTAPRIKLNLQPNFNFGDSYVWLQTFPDNFFDSIITDPDYAISTERLSSNSDNANEGVAQTCVKESLEQLYVLMQLAFAKAKKFFVFFYDIEHHEKLYSAAVSAGWLVQRWPIIWHKVGACSNAAPNYNFPKTYEACMVCRKPAVALAKIQTNSVIALSSGQASKQFGHPFAKPEALWHFLYSATCSPGDKVCDPFVGRGSSVKAALKLRLIPYGSEIQEAHYNELVIRLNEYEQTLDNTVV